MCARSIEALCSESREPVQAQAAWRFRMRTGTRQECGWRFRYGLENSMCIPLNQRYPLLLLDPPTVSVQIPHIGKPGAFTLSLRIGYFHAFFPKIRDRGLDVLTK